jgi:hypothetical protein
MSSIAVFVVLGGAAVAATQLPKNSVGSKQLRKDAVTSAKVKNGSLLKADFGAGQLPAGPKGDTGARGATGADGAQGPAGPTAAVRASRNFAPDVLLGPSSGTNVIDLDTAFAGAARLKTTFASRVVVNAIVNVYNQTSSVQTIDCNIARMNPANTGISEAGQSEWQTLPAGANTYSSMPLAAAFDLPAGEYNIRVICSQIGGNANDTAVDDATLTVVAVAS